MGAGHMQLYAWSHGLAALVYAAFALRLWQLGFARGAPARLHRSLLAAIVLSALWGAAGLALARTAAAWAWWLSSLLDLARYAAWLAFLLQCLEADRLAPPAAQGTKAAGKVPTRGLPNALAWMRPAAAALLGLQLLALSVGALQLRWLAQPTRLAQLGHLALPVLALVMLEQVFANLREDARWAVKPLCLGLLGLFAFDLYLYAQGLLFSQTDADTLAMRGLVHAGLVPLLALSLLGRHQGLARLRLSPRAAFHSVALLAMGMYLLLLSAVGYYVRYFGGDWGRALQQALVALGLLLLLVLLFSGTARARLRVLVGKHLFRYRFDYREEWLRFTHTLSQPASDSSLVGQQIIRGLADMLESPSGALWTLAPPGLGSAQAFRQSARWNQPPLLLQQDADSPLCRLLGEQGWVLDLPALRAQAQAHAQAADQAGSVLPQWLLDAPRAWLLIPLMQEQALIGFCVLDQARTPMELDWEVKDLLKTAGQQAASYLAQAQSAEALLEARKFEAFNRMSAFVAHDLKNIVTQLALMLGNAKRLGANPAFQQDMTMTIEHALDRMRQMLLQLGQPAVQHAPVASGGVELRALLQRIAQQCQRTRGQHLELDCKEPVQVRGHSERLERVLGHMVHNALDATEGGGRAWAGLTRQGRHAQVCIGDSGCGMSQSFIQTRLFRPFQSTKAAGMGIGAFESLQYVQELGGSIAVASTEGQGTVMTLQLPLWEATLDQGRQTLQHSL